MNASIDPNQQSDSPHVPLETTQQNGAIPRNLNNPSSFDSTISRYDESIPEQTTQHYADLRPGDPNADSVDPRLPNSLEIDPLLQMEGSIPQGFPPQMPVTPRRKFRWNVACLGCLGLMMGMFVMTMCALLVGGALVWNVFSRQMGEKMAQEFAAQENAAVTGTPNNNTFQTTYIYDRNGNELHQLFGEGRRTQIKLDEISKYLIDATVAVEDSTFYDNPGVDMSAILRAGLNYFRAGGGGGASTITQQLVRNVVFDPQYRTERSARRKLEEVAMALILTRERSKDQILENYLNIIYYGNLAYGIEAAARTYFNKSAKDLTLSEAALLAGLPQSPAELDPLNPDPKVQDAVFNRRNTVLTLMVDKGKITAKEAADARSEALTYANPNIGLKSPHFTLYAEQELQQLLPAINLPETYIRTGGLKVYTTLDARYQDLAEKVARAQIAQIKAKNNASNAAVIILQPNTGEILAMLGSVDYRDDSIDGRVNVTISKRQPGSSIKPLTYAAALESGMSPATIFWDTEQHIGEPPYDYAPVNYDGLFHGPVRMRDALANSYNIPAVETLRQIGVENFLSFASRMGIESLGTDASQFGLSLTLGGGEVTPLELTRAYSVFANGGNLIPSTSILCVVNNEGKILYQYQDGCTGHGTVDDKSISANATPQQVLDPRIAFVIRDFLGDNNARSPAMGNNSPLRTDGIPTSVKTGTTNDFKDNWTVGFTSSVAIGVWVGNTKGEAMQHSTGLTGAAPIWNGIMTGIYGNPELLSTLKLPGSDSTAPLNDKVSPPAGVSLREICALGSVKEPATDCQKGRNEWNFDSTLLRPNAQGDLVPGGSTGEVIYIPSTENAPIMNELDPSVVQLLVNRLDPNLAASMVIPQPGKPVPPPPLYCMVPAQYKDQTPGATFQAFIKAPTFPDEELYARIYAAGTGYAIAPTIMCGAEMLAPAQFSPGITALISSPQSGQTVTGTVYVTGVATWSDGWYYKMEIQGPQFPDWTTFSGPTEQPTSGNLGNFGAGGLVPGVYKIRIVIVGKDGNYAATSPEVPINVTGS